MSESGAHVGALPLITGTPKHSKLAFFLLDQSVTKPALLLAQQVVLLWL